MSLHLVVITALRALRRNRLRTLLTMLGIMIGIAAVICTVALGEGSAAQIHEDLLNLGDNFVWIENGSRNVNGVRTAFGSTPRLTGDDLDAIVLAGVHFHQHHHRRNGVFIGNRPGVWVLPGAARVHAGSDRRAEV